MAANRKYQFSINTRNRQDVINVYESPQEGVEYSIGVDAATGSGDDSTSIQVWTRRMPFEQVAWFHSKNVNTVIGSKIMVDLGWWYNTALLVIETRFPGNAYQDNAIEVYRYRNLYRREERLDMDPHVSEKFGITTSEADKRLLINDGIKLMENKDGAQVVFHDEVTLNQFCNFVYIEDKDKAGAIQGAHDDDVMGTLLAWRGCIRFPQKAVPKVRNVVMDEDTAHKQYLLSRHIERIMRRAQGKGRIRV